MSKLQDFETKLSAQDIKHCIEIKQLRDFLEKEKGISS
jgi:hypothetical protein